MASASANNLSSSGGNDRVSAPTLSLPKGGGAIRDIGEKFSVNAVNGTVSLSIPIFATPSRSDFYPKLSLSYDSGARNGPFGLGWNLSVPAITRKTDKGLPRYRDAENSDVFILSDAEDLVPLLLPSGTSWARVVHVETDGPRTFTVTRYRPRIEGLFALIESWQDQETRDIYWRSISKDNITSVYGKSPSSRISDPNDSSRIFKWLLEESHDDKGNSIRYEYKQENKENVDRSLPQEGNRLANGSFANQYLKRIKYGKKTPGPQDDYLFEVVFDYGEHDPTNPKVDEVNSWPVRLDPFSNFRAGFEIRTYRLCRRVLMFHNFAELGSTPCLVRSTDFTYNPSPIATYLASVTQSGYIRDSTTGTYQKKSFPSLELAYSQPTLDSQIHFIDAESLENLPVGLDDLRYQWVDLDSEGLSGILAAYPDAWFYKPNRSGQGNAKFAPVELISTQPSLASPGTARQQIMDLAGDGEKSLVQFSEPLAGYYERDEEGQWGPFTPFASNPNISWSDANLRLIDLDGDGFSDVLISEHEVFLWYPSRAKEGFGPFAAVRKPQDEDRGPALVFADPTQSIHLADMTGDGLTDIVRIRNGEVCYWPNMGYGRFGPKVNMDVAPIFDHPDSFDQRRIRLADIDGSGTTDIIYLGRDSVAFWFNQAGNSCSNVQLIPNFPPLDDPSKVTVVDLFGNGTACIVWSSPLPEDAARPMRYIDLMSGQKPHLLTSISNNMGSETRLQYTASTQFYLEDMAAGGPWITKLPFPVQVLQQVETRDLVTGSKLVTVYKYHHGYYDGIEREFRGFGLVEQRDTQSFADYLGAGLFPALPTGVDKELYVPPVRTKTWFHTGAFLSPENISQHFVHEYYGQHPSEDPHAVLLEDSPLPEGPLTAKEEEEALRSLKGRMLRQEIYADDGSPQSRHPYSVTESNYTIRLLQPVQDNPHAVFYTSQRETVTYHYERNPADPRLTHSVTLEEDEFGNVTKSVAIVYPRRAPAFSEQSKTLITYTESDFVNKPDGPGFYRIGIPADTRTFEVTGLQVPANTLFGLPDLRGLLPGAAEISYETAPSAGTLQKRLIQRSRILYYKDDLSAPLPLGQVESRALFYQNYRMVFTLGLITQVYGTRVDDNLLHKEGKYANGADLKASGLFPSTDDGSAWWLPSGLHVFDPNLFYMPVQFVDPFGNSTSIGYDSYHLVATQIIDPLKNTTGAKPNYRTLQPYRITDANGNRAGARFDALGMATATAVMGKEGAAEGDTLDETTSETSLSDDPTTRLEYDLFNWKTHQRPNFVHMSAREQHGAANKRWQESYSYSDGFGREIQKKIQAEPGLAPGRGPDGKLLHDSSGNLILVDTTPNVRWVGTGRTVFDNKGNPVKKYEPFFSTIPDYEDEADLVQWGVTPVLHYDPLSRLIRTDKPDGAFSTVEFDPWQQITSDENDTVLDSLWYTNRGSPNPAGPEPSNPEARAAWLAARHANTPTVAQFDVLGRIFLTIADNGADANGGPQKYPTHTTLDIQGNPLVITDARRIQAMSSDFDMLKQNLHSKSPDAGERWTLQNVVGNAIRRWDSNGNQVRLSYDELHRQTYTYVQQGTAAEILAERVVYADRPDSNMPSPPETANLRGKIYQSFDAAGLVTHQKYDFKGNLLQSTKQLTAGSRYQNQMDWTPLGTSNDAQVIANKAAALLESGLFTQSTTYDALNRPVTITEPDGSVVHPIYNEANLLEQVSVNLRGSATATHFVTNLDYNAKGQRVLCEHGNGASTSYTYDPDTFRLTNLTTTRSSDGAALQALTYHYDPVGSITEIDDAAQQTVIFGNSIVPPTWKYVYDAIYRLTQASSREHSGQVAEPQPQYDWNDFPRVGVPLPTDPNAMRNYTERYQYDTVGNIQSVSHQWNAGGAVNAWTRNYAYDTGSNRLLSTSLPGDTSPPYSATYAYDNNGNMNQMYKKLPHLPMMNWDFKNQLHQVDLGGGGRAYYVYDATGQRVRKVIERQAGLTEERIYLGGFEIYRKTLNGTVTLERETLHVMDDQRRVAMIDTKTVDTSAVPGTLPTSLTRYQFDNQLGSACLEVDDKAALISYEEYYPYGNTSFQTVDSTREVPAKRYRYTGKERDDETGLYYHGARYYAPWLARWTSCDPSGLIDGPNVYQFVLSHPTGLVDKSGRQGEPPGTSAVSIFRGKVIPEPQDLIENPAFRDVAKQVWNKLTTPNYKTFARNLGEAIKNVLRSEKPHELKNLLEIAKRGGREQLRFKVGPYAGEWLEFAHNVSQKEIENLKLSKWLYVDPHNLSPVGDIFHREYLHAEQAATEFGKLLGHEAVEGLRRYEPPIPEAATVKAALQQKGFLDLGPLVAGSRAAATAVTSVAKGVASTFKRLLLPEEVEHLYEALRLAGGGGTGLAGLRAAYGGARLGLTLIAGGGAAETAGGGAIATGGGGAVATAAVPIGTYVGLLSLIVHDINRPPDFTGWAPHEIEKYYRMYPSTRRP